MAVELGSKKEVLRKETNKMKGEEREREREREREKKRK